MSLDPVRLPSADSELAQLIDLMCDGAITPDERDRLESLLENDRDAKLFCIAYLDLHAQVQWLTRDAANEEHQSPTSARGLVASTTSDATIPFPIFAPTLPSPLSTLDSPYFGGVLFSYMVAAMILGVGMLMAWAWKLPDHEQFAAQPSVLPHKRQLSPTPHLQFVGQITGIVDCEWADPHTATFDRAHVSIGRKYALASGLMEITYNTGARVILQGPVTYEVESATGGHLSVGKLTARVEKRNYLPSTSGRGGGSEGVVDANSRLSTLDSGLFCVRTPTAIITDLGTEFGVEVSKQGATTSHVFRGSVSVQMAGGDKETNPAPLVLHENESARVEQSGDKRVIVPGPSAEPTAFVRRLVKPVVKAFDLVDVVAGGDGFSGRRGRGIDARNGRSVDTWPSNQEQRFVSDRAYHRVQGMPFIDGIFIPYGKSASDRSVQLDSAGHSFAWFPNTDGHTLGPVWTGGKDGAINSAELGGVDYDSPGHAVLDMHANKGITFDLEAIRQANPDWKIIRFCGIAGNTIKGSGKNCSRYADLWVFVDGQVRFQRRQITQYSGAMPAVVPLGEKDRFITLVATDGGDDYGWDHTVFGDPRLEMVPAKASTSGGNDSREGR